MKVKNETDYRTDDLRRLIQRVAVDELDPDWRKRLMVRVVYRRACGADDTEVGGQAPLNSNKMVLKVTRNGIDRVDAAQTIAHEMVHCRGLSIGICAVPGTE